MMCNILCHLCDSGSDIEAAIKISDLSVTDSGRMISETVKSRRNTSARPSMLPTKGIFYFRLNDPRLKEVDHRVASVLSGLYIPEPFASVGPILPKIMITSPENESIVVLIHRPNRQMMASLFPFYKATKKEIMFEANEELKLFERTNNDDKPALQWSTKTVVHLIPRVLHWSRRLCCMSKREEQPNWPDKFLKNVDDKLNDIGYNLDPLDKSELDATKVQCPKPIIKRRSRSSRKLEKTISMWTPQKMFPFLWHVNPKKKIAYYFEYLAPLSSKKRRTNYTPMHNASSQTSKSRLQAWPDDSIRRQMVNLKVAKAYKNLTEKRLYGGMVEERANKTYLSRIRHNRQGKVKSCKKKRRGGGGRIKRGLLDGITKGYTYLPIGKQKTKQDSVENMGDVLVVLPSHRKATPDSNLECQSLTYQLHSPKTGESPERNRNKLRVTLTSPQVSPMTSPLADSKLDIRKQDEVNSPIEIVCPDAESKIKDVKDQETLTVESPRRRKTNKVVKCDGSTSTYSCNLISYTSNIYTKDSKDTSRDVSRVSSRILSSLSANDASIDKIQQQDSERLSSRSMVDQIPASRLSSILSESQKSMRSNPDEQRLRFVVEDGSGTSINMGSLNEMAGKSDDQVSVMSDSLREQVSCLKNNQKQKIPKPPLRFNFKSIRRSFSKSHKEPLVTTTEQPESPKQEGKRKWSKSKSLPVDKNKIGCKGVKSAWSE